MKSTLTTTLVNSLPANRSENSCAVWIVESSIFDVAADAFLVSIGENCQLNGEVAKHIKEHFSSNIEKRLRMASPLSKGECILVKDNGWNLIFGMPFDYEITQLTIAGVEMVILRTLEICDANMLKSVAIPAIAANFMPSSAHSVNNIIQLGIIDYFSRNPVSTVENIYLVNYKKTVFSSIEINNRKEAEDKTIYLNVEI